MPRKAKSKLNQPLSFWAKKLTEIKAKRNAKTSTSKDMHKVKKQKAKS